MVPEPLERMAQVFLNPGNPAPGRNLAITSEEVVLSKIDAWTNAPEAGALAPIVFPTKG
jgi:hypothetical protein